MIELRANSASLKQFRHDLAILMLSGADKAKIKKYTAQAIKRNAQSNINKQQSPDGVPWKARQKPVDITGLSKRDAKKQTKMLKNRARYLVTQDIGINVAKMCYRIQRTGEISSIHQLGLVDTLPQANNEKQSGVERKSLNSPATERQARRLNQLGYNVADKPNRQAKKTRSKSELKIIQEKWKQRIQSGKNRHKVSDKEIMQTLTIGQAGVLIRLLDPNYDAKTYRERFKARNGKPLPKRTFLDTDEKRNAERMTKAIERLHKEKK
ncbi:phage virion morphogenesis protein [Bibersteinia trehalosi]|uniref:Phage virion morphogenesis protein n=1 Tax=Bibersteinia trehalosi TaxID=47735 RepID=A0A426FJ24_BIBTR|nr:phage virion morphogenesis protein [Bibersteinia trehalosi]RRN04765.1 phage virion morphogenesis protein [Bibersteinia trehalosi]